MADQAEITQRELSAWLLKRVPAIKPTYDEVKTWTDPDTASYAMLAFVLKPHIEALLESDDDAELQRIFDLLEYLANHGDGGEPPLSGSVKNELGVMMEELDRWRVWRFLGETMRVLEFEAITWIPERSDRTTEINTHVDRA